MNGYQKIVSGLFVLNTVLLYTVLYVAYIFGWGFIMNKIEQFDNLLKTTMELRELVLTRFIDIDVNLIDRNITILQRC